MRSTRHRMLVAGAASAVLVAGTAVGTAAAVSKPVTSVKACVDKKGVLSLISKGKCAKGTHSLALSVKGPTGKTGKTGATGPAGPTGAPGQNGAPGQPGVTGPSDLYFVDQPYDPPKALVLGTYTDALSTMPTTVASVDVPAGTYSATAVVHILGGGSTTSEECQVVATVGAVTTTGGQYVINPTGASNNLSAAGVLRLSSPGTITLRCGATASGNAAVVWSLQAMKVGSAHGTIGQPLAYRQGQNFTS